MKLTIERAALLKALSGLNRVVEKKNTIPILSNVLLQASDEGLTITGTDLDIEASSRLPCETEAEGSITVAASVLHDIVRKLPDGAQIAVETTKDGAQVAVRAGRSRFTLQALPAGDYPNLAAGEFSHSFVISGETLAWMIARSRFAISTEETRYYLNGIFLHTVAVNGAVKMRAVATDGHRLARIELDAPEGADGMPGIIIPRKAVAELERLGLEAGKETLTIDVSAHKIRLTSGSTVLTSKLIDGTFPDYPRVIPTENTKRALLESAIFKAAIDRVSSVSSERGSAVKLAFDDGRVTLSARNPDMGEATDEIEAEYEAEAVEVGFNAKYTLAIIDALACDTILMKLDQAGAPALFSPNTDDSVLCVLMPMRV
jgi:DNA polymerase-3 subunit beta